MIASASVFVGLEYEESLCSPVVLKFVVPFKRKKSANLQNYVWLIHS